MLYAVPFWLIFVSHIYCFVEVDSCHGDCILRGCVLELILNFKFFLNLRAQVILTRESHKIFDLQENLESNSKYSEDVRII